MSTRLGVCLLGVMAGTALAADPQANYEAALACSRDMQRGVQLAPDAHKACVLAIATTYIDVEENSLSAEKQLVADDVSRHRMGTAPDHKPGNRAKLIADMSHSVIAAIKNRQWTVEGNQAWILYDGYLKTDPENPGFYVSERITVENGLIKEILVTGVARK
jgi:hypothetical protein